MYSFFVFSKAWKKSGSAADHIMKMYTKEKESEKRNKQKLE